MTATRAVDADARFVAAIQTALHDYDAREGKPTREPRLKPHSPRFRLQRNQHQLQHQSQSRPKPLLGAIAGADDSKVNTAIAVAQQLKKKLRETKRRAQQWCEYCQTVDCWSGIYHQYTRALQNASNEPVNPATMSFELMQRLFLGSSFVEINSYVHGAGDIFVLGQFRDTDRMNTFS
jgi:hypothetical protein